MFDNIDIYCIGGRPGVRAASIVGKQLHPFSLSIANVADMADKVVWVCRSSGKRLGELTIVDHGSAWGQWMGSDWVDLKSLPTFQNHLQKLAILFGEEGLVTLGGCQQGQNDVLLTALSKILNRPVRGFTAYQRPLAPGNQGAETRCFVTCARGEPDIWDKYIDPAVKRLLDL
jgi:hypothetical protein